MNTLLRAGLTTIAVALLPGGAARAAEMTWTYAVQASATVQAAPARIELHWPADPFPISSYTVHRKSPGETAWSEGVPVAGYATQFIDENVEPGKAYEYQLVKYGSGYTGFGYIAVGLEAPLVDTRGKVILVVDDAFAAPLAGEIGRLQRDLAGDGWTVLRRDVSRAARPEEVKAIIKADYDADPGGVKAVFLLGHIPVVRSGNQNVDGHGARPMPADVFYADMDGGWTDANGDGIYDQSTLPSEVELQIGRVDFADLRGPYSTFHYPTEPELMKRYLNKNHAFRHAMVRPKVRALVGNTIGDANGQAYAASGYRNFAALVGNTNVFNANVALVAPAHERWISLLSAEDYLWAYGGGGGGHFSISGLGLHPAWNDVWGIDFLERNAKGTFYMLFGSWFGDWAQPDNIMRVALAAPEYGLAASWSGRPHHFYHHMGIGETIGHGIRVSQNNDGHYQNQVQRHLRGVHIALMGDPTLRMHQLAPPRDATAHAEGGAVVLSWNASPDEVLGYHVYRSPSEHGPFARMTGAPINETRYTDWQPPAGGAFYLVRAVALNSGPSGSFYNASQGAMAGIGDAGGNGPLPNPGSPDSTKPTDVVWIDDALPPGAHGFSEHDRWNWVSENPAPFSGARAHQADVAPGRHHHFFAWSNPPLSVNTGDTFFAYVYLDPENPPRQIMLTWMTDHWEHRAYWGENLIDEGLDGSQGRRYIGPLPPVGRWARLELPASAVGMENEQALGMGFTLFDGRVTWDRAGKSRP